MQVWWRSRERTRRSPWACFAPGALAVSTRTSRDAAQHTPQLNGLGLVETREMAELAGDPLEGSAEPLANPWSGRMDPSLAHRLGFQPSVPTIYAAARDGILSRA